MLHKEIPFLRIIIPLCLGIISGKLVPAGNALFILLIVFSLSLFVVSGFYNNLLTNYAFGLAAFTALFTCGLILNNIEKGRITLLESKPTVFLTTLSDYPVEKEKTFMLTVDLHRIITDSSEITVKGSLMLYHRKDSLCKTLKPGDILLIKCTPVEIASRGNPYEFDYRSFMASKGIGYFGYTSSKNILAFKTPHYRKLKYRALIIRDQIIKMYEDRGVKGERLALVSAITLGQKNLLDPDAKQIFINAGVMHIMAVSGLHVVILSLFILNVLFFLRRRYNVFRILITILLLWAFAFITGLSPSVLRATLMFTFLQAGNLLKRKVNGINSVLASAFILIILQPSVIADAGFLLSYAAVIYIIGFYNDLYLKINFHSWLPDKIWQSVAVTLIAQAGTLPLTIMLFNRFPVYFIITNVIIVPLSNLLIIVGCLVPLTYHIVPVSEFLASVLDKLTWLTEYLTETASSLPMATIDNIGMTPVECLLLTMAISLFIVFLLKKHSVNIVYPLSAILLFVIVLTVNKITLMSSQELIVYNNPSNTIIGIRTGTGLRLYSNNDSICKEVLRHTSTLGLNLKTEVNLFKPVYIKTGTKRILITDSLKAGWLRENVIDILILSGNKPFVEKGIQSRLLPDNVIITSEAVPGFNLKYYPGEPGKKTIWYVRKSGAFKLRLD